MNNLSIIFHGQDWLYDQGFFQIQFDLRSIEKRGEKERKKQNDPGYQGYQTFSKYFRSFNPDPLVFFSGMIIFVFETNDES